jgi:hypothetical protein
MSYSKATCQIEVLRPSNLSNSFDNIYYIVFNLQKFNIFTFLFHVHSMANTDR